MGRQAYLTRLALVSGINGALSNPATSVLAISNVLGAPTQIASPPPLSGLKNHDPLRQSQTWEAFNPNF